MADFDPNAPEHKSDGGGGNYAKLVTPGTYLLGIRAALAHDTTKSAESKRYTRFALDVIHGTHEGESFTDRVFRATTSYKRLAAVARACRINERFDPDKDSEMERVFVGRALKASVKINESGYAEIKFPEENATDGELRVMKAWEAAFVPREKKAKTGSSGGLDGAMDFDDAPLDDFGDDIPFE